MASNPQDKKSNATTGFGSSTDHNSPSGGKGKTGAAAQSAPKQARNKSSPKAPAPGKRMSRQERSAGTSIIPPVVSNRMLKRGFVFSGIPTVLAFLVIPISYLGRVKGGLEIPNVIVMGVSLGGLVLGLLGITFSVLSASWDEAVPGSLLGFEEFKLNLGRIREAKQSSQRE